MGVEGYIQDHVWVPIAIAVGGAVGLAVLFAIFCCICQHFYRHNRRHYVSLHEGNVSYTDDTISYSSVELRREEEEAKGDGKTAATAAGQTIQSSAARRHQPSTAPTTPGSRDGAEGGAGDRAGEIGVFEAFAQRRQSQITKERESTVLACQFHIRNINRYTLPQTLADIGSRMQKYWFLVNPTTSTSHDLSTSTQLVLTIAPVSKHCPVQLQGANLRTLNELLATLKHPYLQPITEVDYIPDRNSVVVAQPFVAKGSLKDIIYKSQPLNEWTVKYSTRKKGLPLDVIALFGRQVLEALIFLYKKGFPPLGHIQSGNILVEEGGGGKQVQVGRLSGYENMLLGYRTRQYKLFAEYIDAIDVLMFGHLLFEMGCGYELTSMLPQQLDYKALRYQPLLEVMQFIFADDGAFPSVHQVLELPFFQQVELPKRDKVSVRLSPEMKAVLRAVRRGQPVQSHARPRRQPSRQHTEELSEPRYPVTQLKRSTSVTAPSQPTSTHPRAAKPPPLSAKPSLPPRKALPTSSRAPPPPKPSRQSRGALLRNIQKGTKLKKTITSDRSAPRLT